MLGLGITLMTLLVTVVCAADFQLTILHTNDVHDRFEQFNKGGAKCKQKDLTRNKCYGGVSRRFTKIKEIRAEDPNVVLLDAGDVFLGTTWFRTYRGQAAAYFRNYLKYSAMSFGNHEFDAGVDGLVQFLKNVTFPILCSNIDTSKEQSMENLYKRGVILTFGAEKIGIVGYLTPEVTSLSATGPNIKFTDEISAIQKEVNEFEKKGVNKIIALGHSGFKKDVEIALNVSGVDIVIGGHSNTFLYTGEPPSNEKPLHAYPYVVTQKSGARVYVVQDFTFGKYLGYLKTTWNNNGKITAISGNPILLDSSVQQDKGLEKIVQEWAKMVHETDRKVVGKTLVDLNGERDTCRGGECAMGDLIADALAQAYSKDSDCTGRRALLNSGGIKASIKEGNITRGEVDSVLPYRNTVVAIKIKGDHIWKAFENSVKNYNPNEKKGKFLQVSGFKVRYNLAYPNNQRVVSLKIEINRCSNPPTYTDVDINKIYSFITYSYLSGGGDGYTMFADNRESLTNYGSIDSDITVDYIKKITPIREVPTTGRITFE